jgi:hypothetical protein
MTKEKTRFPFSMYVANGEGRVINAHTNESSMEIVEVLRGEVCIQIGTETLPASAGYFIYVPPTLVFRADAVSDNVAIRGMIFDSSILEANMENFDAEVFYMSTSAVNALRVEFELHRGNYGRAAAVAEDLLGGAESRWTKSAFENLWSGNESEDRIFAPYIFDTFYTDLCYDKEHGDYFILSDEVTYGDADVRKAWCEFSFEMASGQVRALGKYNRMYYENATVRYINTMRYSGVCFAAAEAYARDEKPRQALQMVNRLLSAYGAQPLDDSLEGDALIDAILREKHKEFVGEGVRYFDLKRIGKPLQRYKNLGSGVSAVIQPDDYRWLFPIPESEYKYNDLMDQNPEWPFIKTE